MLFMSAFNVSSGYYPLIYCEILALISLNIIISLTWFLYCGVSVIDIDRQKKFKLQQKLKNAIVGYPAFSQDSRPLHYSSQWPSSRE